MNIFDQYGIKEVADVTLYSIHKKTDGSGDVYYVPALYLDTLKISTVEKTAENVWAEGGLGNARLINWDYGKQINVTLEDALCTPASLSMCWNGILSANWQDANLKYSTDVCYCSNPLTKISRMEKAIYPRQDREQGVISNLLPKIKEDVVDDNFGLLKISSVVDGTVIKGMGTVKNHTYKWKMAIESAVQSIAVVPDRFFDVTGKSYSIDWDRKVSVHSLPDYENYKQAIIYKINTRNKCLIPPLAKIIYDQSMNTAGNLIDVELTGEKEDTYKKSISLAELLEQNGYTVYEEGLIKKNNEYYVPMDNYFTQISGISENIYDEDNDTKVVGIKTKYKTTVTLLKVTDTKYQEVCKTELDVASYGSTLVNYLENHAMTDLIPENTNGNVKMTSGTCAISEGNYLAIVIDNNDNYIPLIGKTTLTGEGNDRGKVLWYQPYTAVDTTQFKGLDMWLRFESINELIYFLITKYENDIISISAATLESPNEWDVDKGVTKVNKNSDQEAARVEGKLWAYINPRTMTPYADDYWFHQGEPYYVKSLTLAPKGKQLKGNRITVLADQWPGMYMMVGETYIRNRDTGKDERMQIKFPLCKVRSDHTLTLEAEGDPTTFNLDLEVAKPTNGVMMEITAYEIADKLYEGENGCFYAVDGSSEVLSE